MKPHPSQWCLAVLAVCLFASVSFADSTTSMMLTGVGDGATVYDGSSGVYVDPYTATVGTATNVSVICDDWSNNSYLGETWTAAVTNLSSAGSSTTPMFGSNAFLYDELAWLGTQLLANPTNYNNQVAVSFALWELTYGVNGTTTETPTPTQFLAGSSEAGDQAAVNTLLGEADTAVTDGYNGAGWEILTPTGVGSPEGTTPQEFLVFVPEPSSVLLLMIGLAGLLGVSTMRRKQAA